MGPRRTILSATLALAVAALAACGGTQPAEGLFNNIDKARAARTLSSLQQGLITAQTTGAESAATSSQSLAAALQQRDPSNRYTIAPPTDVGIVQVVGGGGPVMLVGISAPPGSGRAPSYLAVWQSGGSTLFYLGPGPPQYTASPPSGTGWSSSPPQV